MDTTKGNGDGRLGVDPGCAPGRVYLAIGATDIEAEIIEAWRVSPSPGSPALGPGAVIRCPPPTAGEREWPDFIDALRDSPDTLELAPLKVIWLPRERDGRRSVKATDLLKGNPRRPSPRRQASLRRQPDRYTVIAGEPADLGALRARWEVIGVETDGAQSGFARFVARRGVLAVERAAYRSLFVSSLKERGLSSGVSP